MDIDKIRKGDFVVCTKPYIETEFGKWSRTNEKYKIHLRYGNRYKVEDIYVRTDYKMGYQTSQICLINELDELHWYFPDKFETMKQWRKSKLLRLKKLSNKTKAYVIKNSDEFDYINKKFLDSYFDEIGTNYHELIRGHCSGNYQSLILYSKDEDDIIDKEPGWDCLSDFHKSRRNYIYESVHASTLMRGVKLKKLPL